MLDTVAPDKALREAARIARRMRREGNTFARIAAEMGVDVRTVKAWLNYRPRERARKPLRRAAVTPRRKLFAKGLAEGKTPTQAAMAAGCPTVKAAQQFAYNAKNSPEFQDYFARILQKAGLDEESLAKVLKQCLGATKIAGIAVNKNTGTITDKLEVPDYQVRHQAARTGFELHRRIGQRAEQEKAGHAPVILHLTLEDKRSFEALVGGPLAFDVITLPPQSGESHSETCDTEKPHDFGEDHPQR